MATQIQFGFSNGSIETIEVPALQDIRVYATYRWLLSQFRAMQLKRPSSVSWIDPANDETIELRDKPEYGIVAIEEAMDYWVPEVYTSAGLDTVDGHIISNGHNGPVDLRYQNWAEPTFRVAHVSLLKIAETGPFKKCDRKGYIRYLHALLWKGAEVATVATNQVTWRYRKGHEEWLGLFADLGIEVSASAKTAKRMGIATASYPFVLETNPDEVVVKFMNETLIEEDMEGLTQEEKDLLEDGCTIISGRFYRKILNAPRPLDLGSAGSKALKGGKKFKDLSKEVQEFLTTQANRRREDMIREAQEVPVGTLRLLGKLHLKGDYIVREGLELAYGCDVLTSNLNVKKELAKGKKNLWAVRPKKPHLSTRTSTQKLSNARALFPVDHVVTWMKRESRRVAHSFMSGQIEERYLKKMAEESTRETLDMCKEVQNLQSQYRQQVQSLLEGGPTMTLQYAPRLLVDTAMMLINRMWQPEGCKLRIPVPHSMNIKIVSERMARAAGWGFGKPTLKKGEIDISPRLGIAVVGNQGFPRLLKNCGGADSDDMENLYLVKDISQGGKLQIVVIRDPNDKGEYEILTPVNGCENCFEKEIEYIPAKVEDGYSWRVEEVPVREVDLSKMPLQYTYLLEKGLVKQVDSPALSKKREYPEGYTFESFLRDAEEALLGIAPGLFINMGEARSMCTPETEEEFREAFPNGYERVGFENFLDIPNQGGHLEAKQFLLNWTNQKFAGLLYNLATNPKLPRIDRTYWYAKNLQVPSSKKYEFLKPYMDALIVSEVHLEDGAITQIVRAFEDQEKLMRKTLVEWAKTWQQHLPEWVALQNQDPQEANRLWKLLPEWDRLVKGPWQALAKLPKWVSAETKEQAQAVYAGAIQEFVTQYGMVALLARIKVGFDDDGKQGTLRDDQLWNGPVAKLIVDYLNGAVDDHGNPLEKNDENLQEKRRPSLIDALTYKVSNASVDVLHSWFLRLEKNVQEALVEFLRDFIQGGSRFQDLMKSRLQMCYAVATDEQMSPKHREGGLVYTPEERDEKIARRITCVEAHKAKIVELLARLDGGPEDNNGGGGDEGPSAPPSAPELGEEVAHESFPRYGWVGLGHGPQTQSFDCSIVVEQEAQVVVTGGLKQVEAPAPAAPIKEEKKVQEQQSQVTAVVDETTNQILRENLEYHLECMKRYIQETLQSIIEAAESGCLDNTAALEEIQQGGFNEEFLAILSSERNWDRGMIEDGVDKEVKEQLPQLVADALAKHCSLNKPAEEVSEEAVKIFEWFQGYVARRIEEKLGDDELRESWIADIRNEEVEVPSYFDSVITECLQEETWGDDASAVMQLIESFAWKPWLKTLLPQQAEKPFEEVCEQAQEQEALEAAREEEFVTSPQITTMVNLPTWALGPITQENWRDLLLISHQEAANVLARQAIWSHHATIVLWDRIVELEDWVIQNVLSERTEPLGWKPEDVADSDWLECESSCLFSSIPEIKEAQSLLFKACPAYDENPNGDLGRRCAKVVREKLQKKEEEMIVDTKCIEYINKHIDHPSLDRHLREASFDVEYIVLHKFGFSEKPGAERLVAHARNVWADRVKAAQQKAVAAFEKAVADDIALLRAGKWPEGWDWDRDEQAELREALNWESPVCQDNWQIVAGNTLALYVPGYDWQAYVKGLLAQKEILFSYQMGEKDAATAFEIEKDLTFSMTTLAAIEHNVDTPEMVDEEGESTDLPLTQKIRVGTLLKAVFITEVVDSVKLLAKVVLHVKGIQRGYKENRCLDQKLTIEDREVTYKIRVDHELEHDYAETVVAMRKLLEALPADKKEVIARK